MLLFDLARLMAQDDFLAFATSYLQEAFSNSERIELGQYRTDADQSGEGEQLNNTFA